jgi:hypothetical protein
LLFINSIRKEVNRVHELIRQINSGMEPRTKRPHFRLAEQRIKELYDRFNDNQITPQYLLRRLSYNITNGR